MSKGKVGLTIRQGKNPAFPLRMVLLLLVALTLSSSIQPACALITLNVPGSAKHNEFIKITTSITRGSEGMWYESSGLTFIRGYHDHCGFCGDSCLVGDEIKYCTDCCYFGCYDTQCKYAGSEFSETWFGPPTLEFLVTGCGEATIRGRYYGASHEGPFDTPLYKIKVLGGVKASIASAPAEACAGGNVTFDASSSCGAAEMEWDFGDGTTAKGKRVSHAYTKTGTYSVKVKARYKHDSDTASTSIKVRGDCGKIHGKVTMAADGSPLPGVTVVAEGTTKHAASTGIAGNYSIIVPGDDNYALEAYKSGFAAKTKPPVYVGHKKDYVWNAALALDKRDDTDKEELLGRQPNDVDDPVNPATGNCSLEKHLFFLPGKNGLNFAFRVTYNSGDNLYDGPLGFGWTHKYNVFLKKSGKNVVIKYGDGHKEFFTYKSVTGSYEPARSRASVTLADRTGGGYVAAVGGGIQYEFDAKGRLEKIADLNGNAITMTHSTHLDRITDTAGRQIDFSYTGGGRIKAVTSPYKTGNTVTFTYYANGDLKSITDPRGHSWMFAYAANHRLKTETDRKGVRVLSNRYDARGRVVEQVDALGRKTKYAYTDTAVGARVRITPPSGNTVSHEYDTAYNLVEVTDGAGKSAGFGYEKGKNGQIAGATDKEGETMVVDANEWGGVTSLTDRLGVKTDIAYNTQKQPTSIADDQGRGMGFSYDSRNNLTWITDDDNGRYLLVRSSSDGQVERIIDKAEQNYFYTYNSEGLITGVRLHPQEKTTAYTHDSAGRVVQVDFPDGLGSVQNSYDENGNLISMTTPQGHTTAFAYDANDLLIRRTFEPTGATTAYQYDKLGRLTAITNAAGGKTTFAYDADSNLISRTDPDGVKTRYGYDSRNLMVSRVSPSGEVTRYGYDANGRLTQITDPLKNVWKTAYDTLGRVTGTVDPLGHTTLIERNLADTELVLTDRRGKETTVSKDVKGRPTSILKPDHSSRDRSYDFYGNVVQMTDERGNVWQYSHDMQRRPTSVTDPSGNSTALAYDSRGRLISHRDRNGATIQYEYDLDGRLVRQILPDGSEITYAYQYKESGRTKITVEEPKGTSTYVLDSLNRLVSKTDLYGKTISLTYTPGNRLKSMTYPGGKRVTYGYDSAGRLRCITDWRKNITLYRYDALDRLKRVDYPNGTSTIVVYDQRGNVKNLNHRKDNGTTIVGFAFTRDAEGRVTHTDQTGGIDSSVKDWSRTSTYDEVNRTVSIRTGPETRSCQYDKEGNLVSQGSAEEETTYSYDEFNRLTAVAAGTRRTAYTYDSSGNRLSKVHKGMKTSYLRERDRTYMEFDGSGEAARYHIWGNGLVYSLDSSGRIRVYHGDERGSVVAVSDGSGKVVNRYAYDPHGNLIGSSGTTANEFRFLGLHGVSTDENGLCHMNARYYDPQMGRFLNEDPLGTDVGANVYAYANGDPVNRADPMGLQPLSPYTAWEILREFALVGDEYAMETVAFWEAEAATLSEAGMGFIEKGLETAYYSTGETVGMVSEWEAPQLMNMGESWAGRTIQYETTSTGSQAASGGLMTTLSADVTTLSTGTVTAGVAIAGVAGYATGRAISANVPVGYDPVTGKPGATLDDMLQWSFGRGGYWGKMYSSDDPYLEANKWLREELLPSMGLSYSDYLKIKSEVTPGKGVKAAREDRIQSLYPALSMGIIPRLGR